MNEVTQGTETTEFITRRLNNIEAVVTALLAYINDVRDYVDPLDLGDDVKSNPAIINTINELTTILTPKTKQALNMLSLDIIGYELPIEDLYREETE